VIKVPCWKIIRDREAEELIEKNYENTIVKKVDREELGELLLIKLVEDSVRLAEHPSVENAADLLDSLEEWLKLQGASLEELLEITRDKRAKEGRYTGYVVIWLDREKC